MNVHPYIKKLVDSDTINKNSKRFYVRNLQYLCKLTKLPLDELVTRPKTVYTAIRKKYGEHATRKNLLGTVRALFKHNPDLEVQYPAAAQKWQKYLHQESKIVSERILSGEPSDRERLNWIHWRDVVAKERELAQTAYGSMDHLLLAMYVLIEPGRQDYFAVALLERQPKDATKGNYIIMPTNTLVLNVYKTSKSYRMYRRDLPPELMNIIRESLRLKPRQYLFVQDNGHPYYLRNSFTKYTNRVLERLFGKNFTVSMLRHSFISEGIDFNKSSPGDIIQTAKNMHHSVAMQQMYRRIIDKDKDDSSDDEEARSTPKAAVVTTPPHPTPVAPPPQKKYQITQESRFKEQNYIDVPL